MPWISAAVVKLRPSHRLDEADRDPATPGSACMASSLWDTLFLCLCQHADDQGHAHWQGQAVFGRALTGVPLHSGPTTKTCRTGSRGLFLCLDSLERVSTFVSQGITASWVRPIKWPSSEAYEQVEHRANLTRLKARPEKGFRFTQRVASRSHRASA